MVCRERVVCVLILSAKSCFIFQIKKRGGGLFLLRNFELCVFKFMKASVVL